MSKKPKLKAAKVTFPVRGLLDISTAHLSTAAKKYLDRQTVLENQAIAANGGKPGAERLIARYLEGWFIRVPTDFRSTGDMPADLKLVCHRARELRCDFIKFDADGDIIDLPIFEWTTETA